MVVVPIGCSCLGILLVAGGLGLGGADFFSVACMVFGLIRGAYSSAFFVVFALLIVIVTALALGTGVVVAAFEVCIHCAIVHT